MRFRHVLSITALLSVGTLLAREVWEGKPYVEWTQQEAIALLTDSPWAVTQAVRSVASGTSQGNSTQREGSGTCVESSVGAIQEGAEQAVAKTAASASALSAGPRFYTVRFVSAQPVRKAIARWAVLNGRLTAEQAQDMLNQDPYGGKVVVSLSASNERDWSELNGFAAQAVDEENFLLLQESKRKIYAERYVPPVESGIGEALFYFSRVVDGKALITPTEKGISFNCRLSNRTQFRRDFKLKEMVVNGDLAI